MSIRRSGSGNGTGSSTKANNHADASNSASLLGNDEATALNGRHGIVEYHGGGGGDEDEDSDNSSDLDVGHELLNADPLNGDIGYSNVAPEPRTKQPPPSSSSSLAARFLNPFSYKTSPSPTSIPADGNRPPSVQQRRAGLRSSSNNSNTSTPGRPSFLNTAALNLPFTSSDDKSPSSTDWYQEGPGRGVGYDDLTAIDWIFEYQRDRQRLRHLKSSSRREGGGKVNSIFSYLRLLLDDSQVWIILLLTGILVGAIAASIDVTVDWLADLKTGYCSNVQHGGKFYLNRSFCCWGIEDLEKCTDWRDWNEVFGIGNTGGSWVVNFVFYLFLSVCFASVASYLVTKFSPWAKQSGIPEVKTVLGGFVIRKFMGVWTLVTKSLGLCLAVASGLLLGKEGPLVHVACCCANLFMKPFPSINTNEARKREVLSAAAASGISVAFGAPVGGVLFSLEQLSYYFPDKTMWQSFVCAMIAAFTLKAFDPFRTGKTVQYQVRFHTGWHGFEIFPYVIIGILGGLYGGLLIKINMKVAKLRQSPLYPLRGRPILEVAVVAAITAIVTFPITFLRAQATELDYYLFAECIDITNDPLGLCKSGIANTGVIFLLLVSSMIAFVFVTITFGLQIPAGILLPSMTIGALYGRVIGLIVEVWQREHPAWFVFQTCEPDVPCVTPGTYAIIGAASALAGATRMTVSIVVIMFELTGALTYVLPIMIAVMIAKWVGDAMGKRGIYEAWIQFHAYPFLDNRDDRPIPDVPVAQIMTRVEDLVVITAAGHTIGTLRDLLRNHTYRGYPVVSEHQDSVLLGYISRTGLTRALDLATSAPRNLPETTQCFLARNAHADPSTTFDLRPWMEQTPITLNAKSGFQVVVNMFQRLGLRYLIFIDRGALRGLLTKKDVWFVLNEDEGISRGDDLINGGGGGVLREDGVDEQRGLLGRGSGGIDGGGGGGGGRDGLLEGEDEDEDEGLETGVLIGSLR